MCRCADKHAFANNSCQKISESTLDAYLFVQYLQAGFLAILLISYFLKKEIPLTRKLIDTAQLIGLNFYLNNFYSSSTETVLRVYQMSNFSTVVKNFLALAFHGREINGEEFVYLDN